MDEAGRGRARRRGEEAVGALRETGRTESGAGRDAGEPGGTLTADVTLQAEEFRMSFRATLPAAPARLADLLPLARALSDAVVSETARAVEEAGERVSCASGCGACCRNLIALSDVEARRLAVLVEALPEPRRSEVRERFAAAQARLDAAGLLAPLRAPESCSPEEYAALSARYFAERLACPFLEEESCSIYEERPLTCREHLVTSPPELCARPGSEGVRRVRLPVLVFNALARVNVPADGRAAELWVPLVLAPEWAAAHRDVERPAPAPDLLRKLLSRLDGGRDAGAGSRPPG